MASEGKTEISPEIIKGCAKRNSDDQKVVYESLYETMYAICLRYSHNSDEAKDLLQDGFIKLFRKVKTVQWAGRFYRLGKTSFHKSLY